MPAARDPAWEHRHPGVGEAWSFDFVAGAGSLAGFFALAIDAVPGVAWCWSGLVGEGRSYVLVRELEIEVPRRRASREVRADGLWADVNCETPFEHWSVGLEAFGVRLDEPDEALGDERGERLGLGLDLEWEATAEVVGEAAGGAGGYDQACRVSGDVLVGVGSHVETLAVEAHGWRRHAWGGRDWLAPAPWFGGHLEDGTPVRLHGDEVARHAGVDVRLRAPVRLEAAGRHAALRRDVCALSVDQGGAGPRPATGWREIVSPWPESGAPARPRTG